MINSKSSMARPMLRVFGTSNTPAMTLAYAGWVEAPFVLLPNLGGLIQRAAAHYDWATR